MQTLLDVILPVFLVIGFGYVAVWRGLFPVAGVDGVLRFAQSFAVPCLLFQAIANLDLGAAFDTRLLVSFYTGAAICFALGILGARLFFQARLGGLRGHRLLLPVLQLGPAGPADFRARLRRRRRWRATT